MPQLTRPSADIEYVLLREFPAYLWLMPNPIGLGSGNLVVPITSEQKQQQDELRQRIERRRQELLTLQRTAPSEFTNLVVKLRKQDAAEEEAKRFFNQPQASADFGHWAKLDYWTLEEGIALCFGKSPKTVTSKSVEQVRKVSPFAKRFMDALEIAVRARAMDQIADPNIPGFFIAWAKRMELPFPSELEALVAKRAPILDWQGASQKWQANSQQWQEAHHKAMARITELEQELAAARGPAADQGASLDARERKNMLRVIRALECMAALPARGAATSVEAQLQQMGFDGPREATIRKLLDQARALEPDNRNSG
jgi:hypothetical protein